MKRTSDVGGYIAGQSVGVKRGGLGVAPGGVAAGGWRFGRAVVTVVVVGVSGEAGVLVGGAVPFGWSVISRWLLGVSTDSVGGMPARGKFSDWRFRH